MVSLSDLIPADYNPRKISPEQQKNLDASLDQYDLVQPIVANRDTKKIIGGHQRFDRIEARRKRDGLKRSDVKVAVVWVDGDEATMKALNLALNKIHGEWDSDKLAVVLQDLAMESDLLLTGFSSDEISELLDIQRPPEDLTLQPVDPNLDFSNTPQLQQVSVGERVVSFKLPEADVREIEDTLARFGATKHTDRGSTLLKVLRFAVAQRQAQSIASANGAGSEATEPQESDASTV